jgi:LPS-assembly lipoprotein
MKRMRVVSRGLLILAVLALAACGFHLRGEITLAPNLKRVYVSSSDPYGPLKRNVEGALKRAGATIEAAPGPDIAAIKMTGVGVSTVVGSVGANARVNEFNMVYHVDLEVSDSAGKTVLEKQPIEQTRSFTFDQTQAVGTGAEQDQIRREMERDMAQAVTRRIDSLERRLSK